MGDPAKIVPIHVEVSSGFAERCTSDEEWWLFDLAGSLFYDEDVGEPRPMFTFSVHACPLASPSSDESLADAVGRIVVVEGLGVVRGRPSAQVYVDAYGGCHSRRQGLYCYGGRLLPLSDFLVAARSSG